MAAQSNSDRAKAFRARAKAAKAAAILANVPEYAQTLESAIQDTGVITATATIADSALLDSVIAADTDSVLPIADMSDAEPARMVIIAADSVTIGAAVYDSTMRRAATANGPNEYHARLAMREVAKPVEPVALSSVKPVAVLKHHDDGSLSDSVRMAKTDMRIVVSKFRMSKDIWAWFDHVTGEAGHASNWHVENIVRGRVVAHATANKLKTA